MVAQVRGVTFSGPIKWQGGQSMEPSDEDAVNAALGDVAEWLGFANSRSAKAPVKYISAPAQYIHTLNKEGEAIFQRATY